VLLISLEEGVIVAASDAAGALFDASASSAAAAASLVGRPLDDLIAPPEATRAALSLVRAGAIDTYRARRVLNAVGGRGVRVEVCLRAEGHAPRGSAVAVLRSGTPVVAGTVDSPLPDAVQTERVWLVGTVGPDWRVLSVSTSVQEVLGMTSRDPFMSFVHPEDVPHLFVLLSNAAAEVTQAPARLRLRQADGSWLLCATLVAGLADSDLPSFAFIAHPVSAQATVDGTRTRELEYCLRAIVRQFETTGIPTPDRLPDRVPGVDLTCLSQREREIVRLLLAGERVPAIAQELFLAQSTVRNHLSTVFGKCGVRSQQELVRKLRGVS
jgi:DNA-binding CsgD family transcriptional regulator